MFLLAVIKQLGGELINLTFSGLLIVTLYPTLGLWL